METGIKDTSNNGVYHNRRFKEQAEAHGLTVDHHEKYGWTITSPSEELLDFIMSLAPHCPCALQAQRSSQGSAFW